MDAVYGLGIGGCFFGLAIGGCCVWVRDRWVL